jgi:hypothetical protein
VGLVQRAEQLVRLKLAKAVRVEMEEPEGMEAPGAWELTELLHLFIWHLEIL